MRAHLEQPLVGTPRPRVTFSQERQHVLRTFGAAERDQQQGVVRGPTVTGRSSQPEPGTAGRGARRLPRLPGVPNPYATILRIPGAWKFSGAGLIARLPIAMIGIGIVLLIGDATGSYGLAGAVSAVCALAEAFVSPAVARLVDRLGQWRVVPVQLAIHVVGMVLLVVLVEGDAPEWTYFVAAFLTGFLPNVGALVRARWRYVLPDGPGLRTAFSLESVLDEVVFVLGPPLVTVVAATWSPAAAILVLVVGIGVVGAALLLVQRRTEPPASGGARGEVPSALRVRGMVELLVRPGLPRRHLRRGRGRDRRVGRRGRSPGEGRHRAGLLRHRQPRRRAHVRRRAAEPCPPQAVARRLHGDVGVRHRLRHRHHRGGAVRRRAGGRPVDRTDARGVVRPGRGARGRRAADRGTDIPHDRAGHRDRGGRTDRGEGGGRLRPPPGLPRGGRLRAAGRRERGAAPGTAQVECHGVARSRRAGWCVGSRLPAAGPSRAGSTGGHRRCRTCGCSASARTAPDFVLQTPDGQTYGLRIDERLHAALRGDRARLGQLQIQLDQELRPREIQARIRAGENAEDIASASGVPVENIRRFEGPVLLERTVVAESARATHVRRVTDAAATPLGTLVADRLQSHGVPVTSCPGTRGGATTASGWSG